MTFTVDRSRKRHWFKMAVNGWYPVLTNYSGSKYSVMASEPPLSVTTLETFQNSYNKSPVH
jgi:hypothetical protein